MRSKLIMSIQMFLSLSSEAPFCYETYILSTKNDTVINEKIMIFSMWSTLGYIRNLFFSHLINKIPALYEYCLFFIKNPFCGYKIQDVNPYLIV